MVKERDELRWMELIWRLKEKYPDRPIFYHQEAEFNWATKRPPEEEYDYYDMVRIPDVYIALNTRDAEYYRLFRDKPTIVIPTLIDTKIISQYRRDPFGKQKRIIFGASFDDRANGILGYRICRTYFPDYKITQFSRNSDSVKDKTKSENIEKLYQDDFDYIPYLGQYEWFEAISNYYVGLHLMDVVVGGRNSLAFAGMGIPLIASKDLDIQQMLFPELSVDVFDIERVAMLMGRLLNDDDFYTGVRNEAINKLPYFGYYEGKERIRGQFRKLGYDV